MPETITGFQFLLAGYAGAGTSVLLILALHGRSRKHWLSIVGTNLVLATVMWVGRQLFHESPYVLWFMAIFLCLGSVLGTIVGGWLENRLRRRSE